MAALIAAYRTLSGATVDVTESGWLEPTYTATCGGCGATAKERQPGYVLPADAAITAVTCWATTHSATCSRTS